MSGAGRSPRHLRAGVEAALRRGATLEEVERDIVEPAPLAADARCALWLFAWALHEGRRNARGLGPKPSEAPRFTRAPRP